MESDRELISKYLAFQENFEIFHVPYYKTVARYMQILGQDPHHKNSTRNIIVIIMVASLASIFFPTVIEIYASFRNKDIDGVLECLPNFIATSVTCVKILNMHFNRQNFNTLYQMVAKQWVQLKLNGELHVLEEIVVQGNKIAQFYQSTLIIFFILFLLIPLISPVLDIIHPLNETRTRQQLLKVNYMFFNDDDYFFYVYLHLLWGAMVVVFTVVGADWIYMLIIHHNSGLFAVCGYQVQKATTNLNYFTDERILENDMYEKFRNCILMHKEAIRFFDILNESSQRSYLFQIGLSMLSISATAVQTALNINKPEEAMRSAAFCVANQFHLFLLSLPGQVLLDNCFNLTDNIYASAWYSTPVKIQKLLYIMQIRCEKVCSLSAGGLYEMNIENFGTTFKTCMSYITMMMSLRD